MRDKIKTMDYFNDYIEETQDNIHFYRGSLASGNTKPEQIDAVKKRLFLKNITS